VINVCSCIPCDWNFRISKTNMQELVARSEKTSKVVPGKLVPWMRGKASPLFYAWPMNQHIYFEIQDCQILKFFPRFLKNYMLFIEYFVYLTCNVASQV